MHFEERGNRLGPAIVGVPGLLGGIEDFAGLAPDWQDRFHILLLDPNFERRNQGLTKITADEIREVSYESTADDVAEVICRAGKKEAIITGVSLGGKIVYDFAIKYPHMFAGGVAIDVGPGPFEETELYGFVFNLAQTLDMNLPWPEMREELRRRVPEKNLRLMLQTQITYPTRQPPAVWRTGMANFESMLKRQSLYYQFEGLSQVDDRLTREKRFIHVLRAETLCGISHESLERLSKLKSVRVHNCPGTTHFMHVNQKRIVTDLVRRIAEERYFSEHVDDHHEIGLNA